jgi:hypothetical protein
MAKYGMSRISGSHSGEYEYYDLGSDTLWASRSLHMLCRNIPTLSLELKSNPSKKPGRSS